MQWQDVLADKSLQNLPYKIELNEKGKIEMSHASVIHSLLQGKFARLIGSQLNNGEVFTELAVSTRAGVRVPDVAWGSKAYVAQHIDEICALSAPEICVEIVSASNTQTEMEEKIALYLESGAIEVWIVDETGEISYFDGKGKRGSTQFDVLIGPLL